MYFLSARILGCNKKNFGMYYQIEVIHFPPYKIADRGTTCWEGERQSFRNLRDLLLNIIREIEKGILDSNTVDVLHFRLDWLHKLIACLFDVYEIDEQIVNLIRGARDCLVGIWRFFTGYCFSRTTWTPKYSIPSRDQLEFLIGRCFSVLEYATLLGVSV